MVRSNLARLTHIQEGRGTRRSHTTSGTSETMHFQSRSENRNPSACPRDKGRGVLLAASLLLLLSGQLDIPNIPSGTHNAMLGRGEPLAVHPDIRGPVDHLLTRQPNSFSPAKAGESALHFTATPANARATDGTGLVMTLNRSVTDSNIPVNITLTFENGTCGVGRGEYCMFLIRGEYSSDCESGENPFSFSFDGEPVGSYNLTVVAFVYSSLSSCEQGQSQGLIGSYLASAPITVYPDLWSTPISITPTPADLGNGIGLESSPSGGPGEYSHEWAFWPLDGQSAAALGCTGLSSLQVSCVSQVPGNWTVNVTVTDSLGGRYTATGSFEFVIHPEVTSISVVAPVVVGDQLQLTPTFGGGVGPYSFNWSGLPPGCPASPTLGIICNPTLPGKYSVTFSVTDFFGLAARKSVQVVVPGLPEGIGLEPLALLIAIIVVPSVAVSSTVVFLLLRRRVPDGSSREPRS